MYVARTSNNRVIPMEWRSDSRCRRYVSDLSNITPRYLGSEQKGRVSWVKLTFISRLASFLLRWKSADTFSWCWALASKSGGIHLQLPCPCSAPLPWPANLHHHAWLLCRQHMHTFWRWRLADRRCRCWTVGAPGQIPLGRRSWGIVTCSFGHFRW